MAQLSGEIKLDQVPWNFHGLIISKNSWVFLSIHELEIVHWWQFLLLLFCELFLNGSGTNLEQVNQIFRNYSWIIYHKMNFSGEFKYPLHIEKIHLQIFIDGASSI